MVSTSPDSKSSYLLELESRRDSLTEEYLKVLRLLENDLNSNNLENFELHMQVQAVSFRRLLSCRRTAAGAGLNHLQADLEERLRQQQSRLSDCMKEKASSLQTRLKKGTFRKERNRIFGYQGDSSSFVDFSC